MKETKGKGMNCACKRGKYCRYNKAQWKKEKKSIFKKIRKVNVDKEIITN